MGIVAGSVKILSARLFLCVDTGNMLFFEFEIALCTFGLLKYIAAKNHPSLFCVAALFAIGLSR